MSRQESRDRYKKQVAQIEIERLENEKMLIEAKLKYNKEKKRLAKLERMVEQYHYDNLKTKNYRGE